MMRLERRLARLETAAGTGSDENALVYVVRLPDDLTPEEWRRHACAHQEGRREPMPMIEFRYQRGRPREVVRYWN